MDIEKHDRIASKVNSIYCLLDFFMEEEEIYTDLKVAIQLLVDEFDTCKKCDCVKIQFKLDVLKKLENITLTETNKIIYDPEYTF